MHIKIYCINVGNNNIIPSSIFIQHSGDDLDDDVKPH